MGAADVGELDFVIRAGQRCYHIELATKFYLQVEGPEGTYWPGPDARDHWQRKRRRLMEHQLGMGENPQVKRLLRDRFGVDNHTTTHLIYGCLFHPWGGSAQKVEGISASAHWGSWIRADQWEEVAGRASLAYLPKHLWPCVPSLQLASCLRQVNKEQALSSRNSVANVYRRQAALFSGQSAMAE